MPIPYLTARRKVRDVVIHMADEDVVRLIAEIESGRIHAEPPGRSNQDDRILLALREHGPGTAQQIAERSGLAFTAARARMSYLAAKDLVRVSGKQGLSKVWSLT